MRRILFIVILVVGSKVVEAQVPMMYREFKPFRVDFSAGYPIPTSSEVAGYIMLAAEPKYAITDQFAIGLRMEAAVMSYVKENNPADDVIRGKLELSPMITGDYYFSNNEIRPFVGAGAGIFQVINMSFDAAGNSTSTGEYRNGFMFRTGFEFSRFRLGAEYNVVGRSDNGAKNTYTSIKLGVRIGGGRVKLRK